MTVVQNRTTVETSQAATLRALEGREVTLSLRPSGTPELRGRLRGLLESADGLVVYVIDASGRVHTVHHHQVLDVRADGRPE